MTAGAGVNSIDVEKVAVLSRKILLTTSRDLTVAGFFTWAAFRSQGFSGLQEGLEAVEILVNGYWETCFPPLTRLTARKNAIEWLNLRLSEQVEADSSHRADYGLLSSIQEQLKSLHSLFGQRFGVDAPSLSATSRSVLERLRTAHPPEAAASLVAAPREGAIQSVSQAEEVALSVADYYAAASALSPVAHRLPRLLRWDTLDEEPPNDKGRTQLPAPRSALRPQLESLRDKANWQELLNVCRDAFYEDGCHFWLDLQRFSDDALEGIGADAVAVRQSLLRDLAGLLKRVPTLSDLQFADGIPFADSTTKSWIDSIVKAAVGEPSPVLVPALDRDDELKEHFGAARKVAKSGTLEEGLRLLQQGLDGDGRVRTRFLRRLEMAKLLAEHGRTEFAVAILDDLAGDVEKYHLDKWDQGLAVAVWSTLTGALNTLGSAGENRDDAGFARRLDQIRSKISLVDIETALSLTRRR